MKNAHFLKYRYLLVAVAASLLPHSEGLGQSVLKAQRVSDIATGGKNLSQDANPDNFTLVDTRLFFTASDKQGHRGVYVKNLVNKDQVTLAPTQWIGKGNTPKLLKTFKLPVGVTDMDQFTATESSGLLNTGKVYFHVPGSGLWMTYGKTPVSLGKFDNKTINEVTGMISVQADSNAILPLVYFGGWGKKTGQEVYRSEGTAKTTKIVDDIVPGAVGSNPDEFVELKQGDASTVFFRATPAGSAFPQIWSTQTGNLAAAAPTLTSTTGTPDQLVTSSDIGGCYFTMPTALGGVPELWATTSAGPPIQMTSGGTNPQHVTEFPANGDSVIFSGSDSVNGRQIWEANSFIGGGEVLDVINANGDADPHNLTAAGGQFYFAATVTDTNSNSSVYLFQTNGNPGGALPIDYKAGGVTYYPVNPTEITPALDKTGNGNTVFFVADGFVFDGTAVTFHTGVLWMLSPNDGSTQDAAPVLDTNNKIVTGAHHLKAIVNAGSPAVFRLYFARDGGDGFGSEVWVTEN